MKTLWVYNMQRCWLIIRLSSTVELSISGQNLCRLLKLTTPPAAREAVD
jgi:hypothetical protein